MSRLAAINPEFFVFLLNGTTQLKISRFYWSKNNWQRYILTINIFNKTTISCEESLAPSPGCSSSWSDPWICCETLLWPLIQRRHIQKSLKASSQASWKARPPPPTPPYGLLEPVLHLFHVMSGAKSADYHGSCSFLSIYLCWNVCLFVFIYALAHSWDGLGKKNFSKL